MGRRKGDYVSGVLLFDKPLGMSSNAALQRVRRLLNARKAGHTGTLDPMATGLLPLCFGDATKFSSDLLDAVKGYEAVVRFGETTETGDAEGAVLLSRPVDVTREALEAAVRSMTGKMLQTPPMYSALKRNGRPLYELAREGVTVERSPRPVEVLDFRVLGFDGREARVACLVSKGTYIRVLAEDLGEKLGCGAHLRALRRTRVGDLTVENALTLETLEALGTPEAVSATLSPSDLLVSRLPPVAIEGGEETRFRHGNSIRTSGTERGRVRVYGFGHTFLGTALMDERGTLAPERLTADLKNIPH